MTFESQVAPGLADVESLSDRGRLRGACHRADVWLSVKVMGQKEAGTLRVLGNRLEDRHRGLGLKAKYYNAEITVLVSLSHTTQRSW